MKHHLMQITWPGRKRRESFKYGSKYGVRFSIFDPWKGRIIAFDKHRGHLLFIHKKSITEELVDLREMKSCKLVKYTRGMKGTDDHRISRLVLSFIHQDPKMSRSITIFNVHQDESDDLATHFHKSMKWLEEVNRYLNSR